MKAEVFNSYNKYMILKHALKENNVSQTCNLFGISRTTYYNWKRAYLKHGMVGLEIKEHKKPVMPNKVNKTIENEILSYVQRFPEDGPNRIYYELKAEGFDIGVSGIYNVLKRNNLSKKVQRQQYSKNKKQVSIGNRNNRKLIRCFESPKKSYVGYLVIQRIDFIGTFEGIGKIYQYTLYDTYSKWGSVKIYNKKQDIDMWDYFELKLGYLMSTLNLDIDNLLTEKTREFIPYFIKNNKYKDIMKDLNINHNFISHENNSIFNDMDEFNKLLVKEFYSKITKENIDSFNKVERALHRFLRHYNFSRKISNGCNAGKVPAKVILERVAHNNVDLETLPLWILTLINSLKGGDYNKEK